MILIIITVSLILNYVILKYIQKLDFGLPGILIKTSYMLNAVFAWFLLINEKINISFFILLSVITILVVLALIDFKYKIIPDKLNLVLLFMAILFIATNNNILESLKSGLLAGGLFFLIAFITNGGIGGGDIKLISILGLILGFYPIIIVITFTFILAAICSIILLLFKKTSLKTSIPLAPFISLISIIYIINPSIFTLIIK